MASDFGIMSLARLGLDAVVTLPSKIFSYLWALGMRIINGLRKLLDPVVTLVRNIFSFLWECGMKIKGCLTKLLDAVVTLPSKMFSYLCALGMTIINGLRKYAVVTLASNIFSYLWALGIRTPIINGLLRKLLPIYLKVTPEVKVFTILTGNTLGSHETFRDLLNTQMTLVDKPSAEDCDVILAYCPIVSRVGTDIGAALSVIPNSRPAVLMVFHHTNDKYYIVPNTNRFTQDRGIPTVDCLFNDDGLLQAPQNDEAFRLAVEHLKLFQKNEMARYMPS